MTSAPSWTPYRRIRRSLLPLLATAVLTLTQVACDQELRHGVRCSPGGPILDEFDGPAGAPPDPNLWNFQLGAGGADGKLQAYTDHPRNVSLDGKGMLAITAIKEPILIPKYGTFDYSSGRINTMGHLDVCYGRLSARIKFPTGQGLKPAFWLLGSDYDSVGWPAAGEIDIYEQANSGDVAGAALHGIDLELSARATSNTGDQFHEFAMDWRPNSILTLVDGKPLGSWTPDSVSDAGKWVFNDRPMFIVFNMAIGGLAGPPDATTRFPATMLVDWMRYTPFGT